MVEEDGKLLLFSTEASKPRGGSGGSGSVVFFVSVCYRSRSSALFTVEFVFGTQFHCDIPIHPAFESYFSLVQTDVVYVNC